MPFICFYYLSLQKQGRTWGTGVQAVQAGKLRVEQAEAAAHAAAAAAAKELEAERQRSAQHVDRLKELGARMVAERDLWAAAREAYVDRLLLEWTAAARQVGVVGSTGQQNDCAICRPR